MAGDTHRSRHFRIGDSPICQHAAGLENLVVDKAFIGNKLKLGRSAQALYTPRLSSARICWCLWVKARWRN